MSEKRKIISIPKAQEEQAETNENIGKITFYLTPEQADKLDDLVHEYKKLTGERINRNDIVRHLVEHCTIESLKGLKSHNNAPRMQPRKSKRSQE